MFCLESKIKHGITAQREVMKDFEFCLESKIKHGITCD